MCNCSSGAAAAGGGETAIGLVAIPAIWGAVGAGCIAKYRVSGKEAALAGSPARLIRTLTSPRSNSNSAMSFSIKNSMSSFSSFWFIVWGGPASYSLVPAWEPACRTNSLRRSSLNLYKFLLLGRKYFAPGFCYYHHVFNANTPLSWNVRARFHSNHHPGL